MSPDDDKKILAELGEAARARSAAIAAYAKADRELTKAQARFDSAFLRVESMYKCDNE